MTRIVTVQRTTKETNISCTLNLDGTGDVSVSTGVGFFDHMLTAFAYHGMFDLALTCDGDLEIDEHHTIEDSALVLGQAVAEALGDRAGIVRYGDASVPMDEASATALIDVGGRPYSVINIPLRGLRMGTMSTQMVPHALEAFARTAGATLHITAQGENDHHITEASFKAFGRALRIAVAIDPRRQGIPSTKGTT
ncbi:MAG: imidazoleglycerol-phosphate dehydratase HisB [Actinobacteria bacterium]|uniref:Imidazoleglycerol-phosphate dehydratase n=1 Tax=hydrothermal vent metagenome TaxID=652676 RepID=A0A3B0SFD4_9ZZZZ|nr:imidazoleglycerol-phosphate dehydratase HisB [Actinomycetota bacterium]